MVLALVALAVLSRVFTTNSLAGEPTPDEFHFGIYARDLARGWAAGQSVPLGSSLDEGRSMALEAAALSFVLPWDVITIGRTVQALFNALTAPTLYVLGRRVGMARAAALAAALLLLAIPEYQELAWRFWADSQATLVGLAYVAAIVAFARRPAPTSALIAVAALALLVFTKESTLVLFAPWLPLAMLVPFARRVRSPRARMALVGLAALVLLVPVAVVVASPPFLQPLLEIGLIRRTLAAGPVVLGTATDAIPLAPRFADDVLGFMGPRELSVGLLWLLLAGYVWLVIRFLAELRPIRGTAGATAASAPLGWLAAALAWAPLAALAAWDLRSLGRPEPWVLLVAAAAMMAVADRTRDRSAESHVSWSLAFFGVLVGAWLVERLIIYANPRIGSGAALTFRTFMPTIPLFALLAAESIWAMAGVLGRLPSAATRITAVRSGVALALTVLVVAAWTPVFSERLAAQPLLGRVAVHGADPDKAEGLRIDVLWDAQDWLVANLQPSDPILTTLPGQLGWYADLGVGGFNRLVSVGSQPRTDRERAAYIRDRSHEDGAYYVVDFNVGWTAPTSERARIWRQTFEWLATRPNLEIVYLVKDRFGYPVFYVARNHGYAASPSYVDREKARADELARPDR